MENNRATLRKTSVSSQEPTVILPNYEDWLKGGEKQILNKCASNILSNARKRHCDASEQPESPKKIKTPTKEKASCVFVENSPTGLSKKMEFLTIEKISISMSEHSPQNELSKIVTPSQRKYLAMSNSYDTSSKERILPAISENLPMAKLSRSMIEKPSEHPSKVFFSRLMNSPVFEKTSINIEEELPIANFDGVPWIQKFSPLSTDELALDQTKIKEVCNWIDRSLHGSNYTREGLKNHKLLVIHGPTGSVKTTAIKVIAKEKCVGVSEFEIESTVSQLNGRYISVVSQLQKFITTHSDCLSEEIKKRNMDAQIVLVDVNSCFCSPNSKDKFNDLIEKWLRKKTTYWPLVLTYTDEFIISDYETATGYSFRKNAFYGSALSKKIIDSPFCKVIDFPPLKPYLIEKALSKCIGKGFEGDKVSSQVGYRFAQMIKSECRGNIVTAIMKLERAMTLHWEESSLRQMIEDRMIHNIYIDWDAYNKKLDKKIRIILNECDGCSRIDRFTAINRILMNPRSGDHQKKRKYYVDKDTIIHPQDLKERPPLKYNPDEIVDDMAMTYDDFVSVLYKNLPRNFEDIFEVNYAAELLSVCDLFVHHSDYNIRAQLASTGISLASRGMLAAHTHAGPFNVEYDYSGCHKMDEEIRKSYRRMDSLRQKNPNLWRFSNDVFSSEIYPYFNLIKKERQRNLTGENNWTKF
ncbi:18156_t:CDS:1 [Acaulospora morrowiae]|uniref:18156_t:CDS:1 n=1 Tax=Acaulospora morrowiae TaxID=94023 RepID=A0A9N8VHE0_9GLOM|nr:18156_t:CDS:1 [Acaulospora morrowiae]